MAAILYQGSVEKKRFSRIFSGFFQLGTKKDLKKRLPRQDQSLDLCPAWGLERGRIQNCNRAFAAAQLIEIPLKQ